MLDASLLTENCCTVETCAIVEIQESLTQELTCVKCSYSIGRLSIYRGSVKSLHCQTLLLELVLPH